MRQSILKVVFAVSLIALGLAAASWVGGASAQQPPAPPGQGPCSHGNTGKECKPDPSPNGKDCDAHGNNGGVNEDHCLVQTTTTVETTTTDSTTTGQSTTTNDLTTTDQSTSTNGTTTNGTPTTETPTTSAPSSSSASSGVLGKPPVTKKTAHKPKGHLSGVLGNSANAPSGQLAFTP